MYTAHDFVNVGVALSRSCDWRSVLCELLTVTSLSVRTRLAARPLHQYCGAMLETWRRPESKCRGQAVSNENVECLLGDCPQGYTVYTPI